MIQCENNHEDQGELYEYCWKTENLGRELSPFQIYLDLKYVLQSALSTFMVLFYCKFISYVYGITNGPQEVKVSPLRVHFISVIGV